MVFFWGGVGSLVWQRQQTFLSSGFHCPQFGHSMALLFQWFSLNKRRWSDQSAGGTQKSYHRAGWVANFCLGQNLFDIPPTLLYNAEAPRGRSQTIFKNRSRSISICLRLCRWAGFAVFRSSSVFWLHPRSILKLFSTQGGFCP